MTYRTNQKTNVTTYPKVWAVATVKHLGYGCEGYPAVVGVFDTKEKAYDARNFAQQMNPLLDLVVQEMYMNCTELD